MTRASSKRAENENEPKMNARKIQQRLMIDRYREGLVCPNYTPNGWWECDVFEMTKAGFFREYEIKLSLQDFRADRRKVSRHWNGEIVDGKFQMNEERKHDFLARGDSRGPVQFWFVAPRGIIPVEEVPEWAGLMECSYRTRWDPVKRMNVPTEEIAICEIKKARRLHGTKADPKIKEHVNSIFYYRFQNLFLFKRLENENEKEAPEKSALDPHQRRDQTAPEIPGAEVEKIAS